MISTTYFQISEGNLSCGCFSDLAQVLTLTCIFATFIFTFAIRVHPNTRTITPWFQLRTYLTQLFVLSWFKINSSLTVLKHCT